MSSHTLVLQSHSPRKIRPWLKAAMESVQTWADCIGADYRFVDDKLFDYIPATIFEKFKDQPVIASDLARLRLMQAAMKDRYSRVIWCDADFVIFDQNAFKLPNVPHLIGREVWVQNDAGKLKAYRKVHNAFLMACADDSFLPFYADRVERLLQIAEGPLAPQFAGPKYLTALDNISKLNVFEPAGMLSPLVMRDVLTGGGEALEMMLSKHKKPIGGVNLAASYLGRESDGVINMEADYEAVIDQLVTSGFP